MNLSAIIDSLRRRTVAQRAKLDMEEQRRLLYEAQLRCIREQHNIACITQTIAYQRGLADAGDASAP